MRVSVYLHTNIVQILRAFGDLSEVINKILDAADAGAFDIMDKPPCGNREKASRYNVNITNETYLSLLNEYGPTSPRISLRKLLYWFVDNEIYEELGWTQTNAYVDKNIQFALNHIERSISELERVTQRINLPDEYKKLEAIAKLNLLKIQEYIQNV